MTTEQKEFYRLAAKGYAASTLVYQVDAVVHLENANDEWFWKQVLSHYHPTKKFLFKGSSPSINKSGEIVSEASGSLQCLKYRDHLSSRFFICIDSDYHHLYGDKDLDAQHYILQTYTYSWENHMLYAPKVQRDFQGLVSLEHPFDFEHFLKAYSLAVYPKLRGLVHTSSYPYGQVAADCLNRSLSQQYRKGDDMDDGASMLMRLTDSLNQIGNIKDDEEATATMQSIGITETNAYLFVRGHNLYNTVCSIGEILCRNTHVDFASQVLHHSIAFDEYDEIKKIAIDSNIILCGTQ